MGTRWQDKPPLQLIAEQTALQQTEEDIEALRALTMQERLRMFESVCRTAMEFEAVKIANGLPASEPTPWPASTRELLRRFAQRGPA